MSEERFECRRRGGRHVRIAQCNLEHRLASASGSIAASRAMCRGCEVGAVHRDGLPARTWADGSRVRWIGELPPELELERLEGLRANASGLATLSFGRPADAAVIHEARTEPRERVHLALVRSEEPLELVEELDREIAQAVVGPELAENVASPSSSSSRSFGGGEGDRGAQQKEQTMGAVYEHNGKKLSAIEWCREPEAAPGLKATTLTERIKAGWPIGEAITAPLRSKMGGNAHRTLDEVVEKRIKKSPPLAKKLIRANGNAATPAIPTPPVPESPLRVVWYAGGVEVYSTSDLSTWVETFAKRPGAPS